MSEEDTKPKFTPIQLTPNQARNVLQDPKFPGYQIIDEHRHTHEYEKGTSVEFLILTCIRY